LTRLAQLEAALVKADAAGNVDDARALAAAIRAERGKAAATPSSPPARSTGQEVGRQIGLTGRAALEGGADLLGIVTNPVAAGLAKLTGQPFETLTDLASRTADAIGLPKPETDLESVVNRAGRAMTGAAASLGAGGIASAAASPTTAAVGSTLVRQPVAQMVAANTGAAAGEVAKQEGAGAGGQLAASLAGALVPTAAPAAIAEVVRRTARGGEVGRVAMQGAIDDFAKAGTTPTLAQASPGHASKVAEAVIRQAPGGSGVMGRRLEAQAQEIGKRVDELAGQLSTASGAERGGKAVIRGITGPGGFMDRFKAKSGELYDEVQRLLPQGTTVPASSTQRVLGELTTPIQGAANTSAVLQNAKVASIAKAFSDDLAAGGGSIGYDAMKRLRTQVGELMDDSILSPDTSTRQLRALYGAMSDDLTAAAKGAGDPKVAQAVSRANDFYKAGMKRIEEIERIVDKNGGPEAVYRAVFTNSREGGTTLRRVMQSLDGPQQKDLAAATLRRLGKATPGAQDEVGEVFSPETFLTNWNRMAPEAKNALFDRFGSTYRSDLDKIAAATSKMRDAAGVLPNNSNTTTLAVQGGAWGALGFSALTGNVGAAATIGSGMAASNVMARVFTNPRIVRELAKSTQMPAGAAPAVINQLARIAADGDQDARELIEMIEAQKTSERIE